jgi:hypothetical protein
MDYIKMVNEELIIKITKVAYEGEFSHWEVDVESDTADAFLAGTAPTIWGVLNMATDYLWDKSEEDKWFKDDANNRFI